MEVSPDGKVIAAALKTETIKLFDLTTAQVLQSLETKPYSLYIAFSPDSRLLASLPDIIGPPPVKLWNVKTGSLKAEISDGVEKNSCGLAFSPDGRTLAGWSGIVKVYESRIHKGRITIESSGQILLWDLETGRLSRSFKRFKHLIWSLSFSADGKTLASAGDVGWQLWDTQTGMLLKEHSESYPHRNRVFLAGATELILYSGDRIKIFDVRSGKQLRELKHESDISDLALSNDGQLLVSAGLDRKLKFWDVNSGQHLYTLDAGNEVVSNVAFSPDGKTLVTGSTNGLVKIWRIE